MNEANRPTKPDVLTYMTNKGISRRALLKGLKEVTDSSDNDKIPQYPNLKPRSVGLSCSKCGGPISYGMEFCAYCKGQINTPKYKSQGGE